MFFSIISYLIIILFLILCAAFLTLLERQILANVQRRKGPNVVGFQGVLQPFADAFKLLFKETAYPIQASKLLFIGSSLYIVFLSLVI